MMRQQTAIEFLSTYSFAIFALSLVLITAVTISLSIGSVAPVYSACNIQPLITCQQSLLTYNSVGSYFTYLLIFRNNLGFYLSFPQNAINLTMSGLASGANVLNPGSCSPSLAPQGSQVICIVKVNGKSQVKQGVNTYTQFHVYYSLCTSSNTLTCTSTSNSYAVTGYSFQTLSPPYSNLYNITITSANGLVVINGESYLSNAVVYLAGGSGIPYTMYAQPNAGYRFTSWSSSGGASLSTTSQANTVLTLTNNGNVVASFCQLPC
ncbi:MAG: hypothetical protein KGH94_00805 [Candidatus Micrarchaeota archaeon]|nr:hypothetical protein [Candidatus Micrarchaeota archaeon]